MIRVKIEGVGSFQIEPHKVAELMQWLNSNNAVKIYENNTVQEVRNNQFTGRTLVNG